MSQRSKSEQVLKQLVSAARCEAEPRIDFERLAASVRSTLISQRVQRPRPQLHWKWLGATAVAISFCAGGWYGHSRHNQLESPVVSRSMAPRVIDGSTLPIDQELEAGREPLIVSHPGVARWTLNTGGKARLINKGAYLTVQLDEGSIEASVVPSAKLETFAIESGALRVAVHGTSFYVTKTIDSLDVVVSSGTVVVGPSGSPGQTTGTVMHAPARQKFTASVAAIPQASALPVEPSDGASSARSKPSASSVTQGAVTPSGVARVGGVSSAEVPVEDHPGRVAIEAALDTVRAAVAFCFADAKSNDLARDDSRVSVRVETRLTISVSPEGTLAAVAFAPPIPNTIVECARHRISDYSTTASKLGTTASRQIMLTR